MWNSIDQPRRWRSQAGVFMRRSARGAERGGDQHEQRLSSVATVIELRKLARNSGGLGEQHLLETHQISGEPEVADEQRNLGSEAGGDDPQQQASARSPPQQERQCATPCATRCAPGSCRALLAPARGEGEHQQQRGDEDHHHRHRCAEAGAVLGEEALVDGEADDFGCRSGSAAGQDRDFVENLEGDDQAEGRW